MPAPIDDIQAKLNLLIGALDGQDAGAIIAATEELATAVILFRGTAIPAGSEAQARTPRSFWKAVAWRSIPSWRGGS